MSNDISILRDIDVGLLRCFVAVAETGRMTTAARIVNRSQGAVSQQIRRLEALFGSVLFERRAEAVRLTRDGERLVVPARRMIALNDEVMAQMRGADFTGEVRLGVPHDLVVRLMPPILRDFRHAHPNVLLTLVSDNSAGLRAGLRDGSVDLALTTDAGRGDDPLMADRLVWVGAEGGDAHVRRPLSVALGDDSCAFRASAVRALAAAGIDWRPVCQIGSLEPVYATLEADVAIAAFLSRTVPDRLVTIEDPALPVLPRFHINLNLPPTGPSPVAVELAAVIRDHFARRYG